MTNKQPYQVVMPKLGLIMTDANLLEWFKSDGERVEKGDTLFSFESDKSVVEIEAPASGIVQTLVEVGATVEVAIPIAMIFPEGAEITAPISMPAPKQDGQAPSSGVAAHPKAESHPQGLRATPKARKTARARGINLSTVSGTGPRGMIVTADLDSTAVSEPLVSIKSTPVARKMAADCGIDLYTVTGSGKGGRITRDDVSAAIAVQLKSAPPAQRAAHPLPGLRGLIAERLSISWNERPQVTLHSDVDATQLVAVRDRNLTPDGQKVSFNAYFTAAAARALAEFPAVNSQLTENGLARFDKINIGLAIDTERGLVVPVLKDTGELSLLEIEAGLTDLVDRALSNKTLPEDFSGGTFTITNLGAFGVDSFTPIINPPEATILGLGRINPKPVVVDDVIGIRQMITLSLSFDHRLIDGAPAARFLQRICQFIEDPETLI
ncbi:MAG: 2-oxo acid dehydrogenase subunit E2 [Chloroflexi bacterium]|nr:2-oxo acid dehydrogenase subunit E2 [Chloroflexota bacterium]MBL7164538.1 2-oxo acid dehydrogenase subunit E2 [Anaerolineales bacterium]